jgi:hypothetical protein
MKFYSVMWIKSDNYFGCGQNGFLYEIDSINIEFQSTEWSLNSFLHFDTY